MGSVKSLDKIEGAYNEVESEDSVMVFEKGNLGYFLSFVFIGALLGSALGALIAKMVPALSLIKENLTGPVGFNLEILSFSLRLNISAVLGIVAGVFLFKKA